MAKKIPPHSEEISSYKFYLWLSSLLEEGSVARVAPVTVADATDADSAVALANACKSTLNGLIGALQAAKVMR